MKRITRRATGTPKAIIVAASMAAMLNSASASVAQEPKNLAYDKPAATVPPRLTEHSRKMEQRVYKVADNVY